jgi:hypothetical protein
MSAGVGILREVDQLVTEFIRAEMKSQKKDKRTAEKLSVAL